jgi:hypothetical protein
MSDGTPCGAYGLSLLQETELVRLVSTTVGTTEEVARIALEATQYDTEDAIDLLVHAQWVAPAESSQAARSASMRDRSQAIMDICGVEVETADAVLRYTGNDADAAVDILTHGLWNPDAVSSVEPTNTTCCHQCPPSPQTDLSIPPTSIVDESGCKLFVQGDYACYVRTGEMLRVISVHTEDAGAQSHLTVHLLIFVPVRAVLHSVNHRRHGQFWKRETSAAIWNSTVE